MSEAFEAAISAWDRLVALTEVEEVGSPAVQEQFKKCLAAAPLFSEDEFRLFFEKFGATPRYEKAMREIREYRERQPNASARRNLEMLDRTCWWESEQTRRVEDGPGASLIFCSVHYRQIREGESIPDLRTAGEDLLQRHARFMSMKSNMHLSSFWGRRAMREMQNAIADWTQESDFHENAFLFVFRAYQTTATEKTSNAVSVNEVCLAFRDLAQEELGRDARQILAPWGVKSTADLRFLAAKVIAHFHPELEPDGLPGDSADGFDFDAEFPERID